MDPEQRKLLKEMVKIVPSFIMKSKADAVSQAKTDFLSRMSHEIRTPMNAISGMTTIAKSVLSESAKDSGLLEKIESANTYLLGLSMIYWICPASKAANWNSTMKPWISPIYYQAWNPCSGPGHGEGALLRIEDMRVMDRCLIADSLRLTRCWSISRQRNQVYQPSSVTLP